MPSSRALARPRPVSDQRVLSALAGDGAVSFQGLRRLLGLHPQVLSRILKRLREEGLVADAAGGYRLSLPPEADVRPLPAIPVEQSHVILAWSLPGPEALASIERHLTGKWFRTLRWIGKARIGSTVVLAWLLDPSGRVLRLVLDGRSVRLEVAPEAADDPRVHEGVRALLPAMAAALAPPARVGASLLMA
ncbi:MAG: MarR family transcriptional regulator [Thermoplasmatota archaeon]